MRRARRTDDLLKDPRFPFQVGSLIGAAEMCAQFMALQEDERTKAMGTKLAEAVGWFFTDEEVATGKSLFGSGDWGLGTEEPPT